MFKCSFVLAPAFHPLPPPTRQPAKSRFAPEATKSCAGAGAGHLQRTDELAVRGAARQRNKLGCRRPLRVVCCVSKCTVFTCRCTEKQL